MPENALHKTDLKSFYALASARSGHAYALAGHLFDNEQTACMEASFKFNHQLPSGSSCKRRGGSGPVGLQRCHGFRSSREFR
jgi:hypothetical protein